VKRLSPHSRRLFLRLGTAAVGALVAISVASPASACTYKGEVEGSATCQEDTGTWKVDWTIKNDKDEDATISSLVPSFESPVKDTSGNVIEAGTTVPKWANGKMGELPATQIVEGKSGDTVTLTVTFTWKGTDRTDTTTGKVELEGVCETPVPPSATPSTAPSVAPTASPSVAPSASSGLPVTGAPTIAIISVAAVLIVGGGALLIVTRRRRNSAASNDQ
jgi:LPXTG-motif cell wall-anchored protein